MICKKKNTATVTEKDKALEQLCSSKKLIEDLTEQLTLEGQKLQAQKEADSQKYAEREAALKRSIEDLEAKNEVVVLLEKQVKEFEQKLQLADTKSKEKDGGATTTETKDGVEVKSRDIGLTFSTPTKRKSKKKLEAASAQAPSSSSETHTQTTTKDSPVTTLKFTLGVALVSVIIGIILGKSYY